MVTTRKPRAVARTQLDAVPEAGRIGIQPVQGVPVAAADQQTAGGDAEVLPRLIALTLVDLPQVETEVATTRTGDRDAHLAELVAGPVTASGEDELGTGDVHAGIGDHVAEQLLQGVGRRDRVVVQQPEPVVGVRWRPLLRGGVGARGLSGGVEGCRLCGQGGSDPGAETAPGRAGDHRVQHTVPLGSLQQLQGAVGAAVVDGDQSVRLVREAGQGGQCLGQPRFGVQGDQDGRDGAARDVGRGGVIPVLGQPGPAIRLVLTGEGPQIVPAVQRFAAVRAPLTHVIVHECRENLA